MSSFRRGLLKKLTVQTEPLELQTNMPPISKGDSHKQEGVGCSALRQYRAVKIAKSALGGKMCQKVKKTLQNRVFIIYFFTLCFAIYEWCYSKCFYGL